MIWGSHIRWASLCPTAWSIVNEGLVPMETSIPEIIETCGKEIHDQLQRTVKKSLLNDRQTVAELVEEIRYYVKIRGEWREIVVRPDSRFLYMLNDTLINLIVETTTRSPTHIPIEWLASYAVGSYIENLRPTFILLATPHQTSILPLTSKLQEKLLKRLEHPPRRKPTPSLCMNCDLRQVCDNPLTP